MIILHGPDGSELHVRSDHIVMMHSAEPGAPRGSATTIHLSNGQEWHVSEPMALIAIHLGK